MLIGTEIKEGIGKFQYKNGDLYDGEWRDNKFHGRGKLTMSSGTIYEGNFENNKMHGHGSFTFANGDKYTGLFENDQRTEGIVTCVNGDIFRGDYSTKKEKICSGTMKYINGDIYEGMFLNIYVVCDLIIFSY